VPIPIWEHTCCRSRRWSAARLCDCCGAPAALFISGVSIEEVMARPYSLDGKSPATTRGDAPNNAAPNAVAASAVDAPPSHRPTVANGGPAKPAVATRRRPVYDEDEDKPVAVLTKRHGEWMEPAIVPALCLILGFYGAFKAIGAVVEFQRGNHPQVFLCVVSAAVGPFVVAALLLESWRDRRNAARHGSTDQGQ
jgi:hypothetical protein